MAGEADDATLDAGLRAAAARDDAATLAGLYRTAGDRAAADSAPDAAAFFWTQAHVWALVAGDKPLAATLEGQLRVGGRLD